MDLYAIQEKIQSKSLKIAVFGLGRIGLPTALMFTKGGYHVVGVDINQALLDDLKQKSTFVDEPGLPEILANAVDGNMIEFTLDAEYAVNQVDVIVICVPTPINEDKAPDYRAILDVAQKIGKVNIKDKIIIVESSVSPTTTDDIVIPIMEKASQLVVNQDFGVCSCPERADPGKIVDNFNKVARIVGGSSDGVGKTIVQLYESITEAKIVQVSSPGTANAVKLTENIFRDVNIALMNELAVLYERLGIDVKEVIKGSSTKYNFQPHYPGPGVGGPCLPANPFYIIKDAVKVDYIPFLIRVAREVNDRMPNYVLDLIVEALNHVNRSIKGSTITILGISYKANVRDVQISPSVKVVKFLQQYDAHLKVWDPYYKGEDVEGFSVCNSFEEAVKDTNCIVLLTDHNEFFFTNFEELVKNRQEKLVLVDSRNIYDMEKLPKGLVYCGVGRKLKEL